MTDEEMDCKAVCDSIPCKTMCAKCKCNQKIIETSKAIMEMRNNIAKLEKENAELKQYAKALEETDNTNILHCMKVNGKLYKAKEIIKDYMIIVKGAHTAVCGVSEENRTINVLKLNEEAEQFIKE